MVTGCRISKLDTAVYIKEAEAKVRLSNYFLRNYIYLTSMLFYVIKKPLNAKKKLTWFEHFFEEVLILP